MESHEPDLRAEIPDSEQVAQIQTDYRKARLDQATMVLLDFAIQLTLHPTEMSEKDIGKLRTAGFDDPTIVDAIHTIAYFNYANRVMDALGVEPEPEMRHARRT